MVCKIKKMNKLFLLIVLFSLLFIKPIEGITTFSNQTHSNGIDSNFPLKEDLNPTQILKNKLIENENSLFLLDESPSIVEQVPSTESQVGDIVYFNAIVDFDTYEYTIIEAQLMAIGEHSYVYLERERVTSSSTEEAEKWGDEFDNKIYSSNIEYFGHPDGDLGDIDGDPRVTIFLLDLGSQIAGYFDPVHEYSNTYYSVSNQREMLFINDILTADTSGFRVLAHEFQHLIHFNHDPYELWFIDEGCAELAAYINGYLDPNTNLTSFARDHFASNPHNSLLYWNYFSVGGYDVRIDYGGAYLFMFYIAEKYGAETVKDIVSNTLVGAEGIEESLKNNGQTISFNQLYLNWITALTIDEPSIEEGLYGFENIEFTITAYSSYSSFPTQDIKRHVFYGFNIAKIDNMTKNHLRFEIDHPGTSYGIGMSMIVKDTNGWSIYHDLKDESLSWVMNGTMVQKGYIITSIMSMTTPFISYYNWKNQMGLGFSTNLNYSMQEVDIEESPFDILQTPMIHNVIGLAVVAIFIIVVKRKKR